MAESTDQFIYVVQVGADIVGYAMSQEEVTQYAADNGFRRSAPNTYVHDKPGDVLRTMKVLKVGMI